jgi:PKD repeat protein
MELLSQYISCPPLEAIFDNQSLGTNLTYNYDFGDGNDSTTVSSDDMVHTYGNTYSDNEPWPYTITLTTTTEFGCEDFTTQTVYVFPEVHVDFAFDPNTGCNPHTPVIHNYTSASAFYYNWNFDDGFTSYLFEPIHRFVNTTTEDRVFNVSLNAVSTYDCEDTQTRPLTVYAAPIAEFAINPPLSVFPNATYQMINYSNPADPSWNYLWNYGDGYGDDQPHLGTHTYTYETWGPKENSFRYRVSLEIWNENCYDSVHHYLSLLPPLPIVLFEAEHYQSCSPLEVYFINNSMYGDSCLWDFGYFDDEGNPVTSKEWEPYHVFVEPGYYNVGLTVWGDGGENHYFATFQVWVNPVAAFAVLPERVMLPQATVRLFNLSENAYRSIWDLGDGTITTVRDPIHTYKELGEYRVTLTVYTEYGCEDTESRYPAVWVEGAGYIRFPNAFVPSPHGSNGGYYDAVDFANEVFHPYSDGVIEYRLMVFNRWGEQIFESKDIKIGWDGYYKDKLCDQGVYVWRAVGRFANGKQFNLKGNVTLLR